MKTKLSFQSLGNHEFDDAVDGVIPFIRNLTSPVLAANLILDKVPELENEPNLYKSKILIKNGIKIGIIGYLTPDTKFLAPKNKVEYEDEITAIRREVSKLKEQGVKIIIALGHSGFIKDLEIARQVEDLDLVIGGHSNTFLWNSNSTNEKPEFPQGLYPTLVAQSSGKMVPVVQAYAYTKYMGRLHLVFDSNGDIIKYDGAPLLLNQKIPKDLELLELVNRYRKNIDIISNEIVGSSMVYLNAEECRLKECNMGNVITDALLYYTKEYYSTEFPDVNIGVVQGGRIRSSINKEGKIPFSLTKGDWMTVLPFSDTLSIVTMNGTTLMQTLEHSVDSWRIIDTPGQFIQFSGMKVIYDLAKPPGSRVVQAKAVCSNCKEAVLSDIQENYEYKLMMSTFLADTGDGYMMFEDLPKETVPYNEITSILAYLKKYSPINPTVSGRITLLNEDVIRNATSFVSNSKTRKGKLLPSKAVKPHVNLNVSYFIASYIFFVCIYAL